MEPLRSPFLADLAALWGCLGSAGGLPPERGGGRMVTAEALDAAVVFLLYVAGILLTLASAAWWPITYSRTSSLWVGSWTAPHDG